MSLIHLLLTSARPAAHWTRARLGSSWFNRLMSGVVAETCRVPVPVPIPVPRRTPRFGALVALALAVGVATPALAQHVGAPRAAWDDVADGRIVDVQVLVDGRSAPLYTAPGRFDRQYFQAFKGRNYSLEVTNKTGRRVGVLIAVDGLNVVSGERSSLSRNESMYVLDPWESAVIRGWRTSLNDVRRFVFVDEERSYAERTGQANGDMGWIRVLAFRENEPFAWGYPGKVRDRDGGYDGRQESRPQGAAPESSQDKAGRGGAQPQFHGDSESQRGDDSNPGTGWGEQRWDPVRRTQFEAERRATDHMVLRYEYASGLRALGITPLPWFHRDRTWDRENGGFASYPKW